MPRQFVVILLTAILFISCSGPHQMMNTPPLQGLRITIDPGHGNTRAYDDFRQGPAGEREEWINLRVATYLADKLKQAGAEVLLTRTSDRDVSLGGRAALAKCFNSDLLVSIHHNGSGNDPDMDLPIVYFFGQASDNPASVDFARILLAGMRDRMIFREPEAGGVYSDHLIYSSGTSILRNTVSRMPGVIGEGGFFTNPEGEKRLKSRSYNRLEAEVYYQAILQYFKNGLPKAELLSLRADQTIDLQKPVQFKLSDGLGGHAFDDTCFQVLQDGHKLNFTWDSLTGILSAEPEQTTNRKTVFQVFGRNLQGNALHPKPVQVLTQSGLAWYSETSWQAAFNRADSLYQQLDFSMTEADSGVLAVVDEALHCYQLSLELQIVHPRVQTAERHILELLQLKQTLTKTDATRAIRDQQYKLKEYYP